MSDVGLKTVGDVVFGEQPVSGGDATSELASGGGPVILLTDSGQLYILSTPGFLLIPGVLQNPTLLNKSHFLGIRFLRWFQSD